ncbi:MAG TPA: heme-binding domain-containing protein, partial [Chloroflexota bacterium]|nr:heme-binding domain-containing protein [Chloroflexota bacterium]
RDVYAAREKLNFTEWDRSQQIEKAPELVISGEMPLQIFLLTHPEARLTPEERQALAQGLTVLAEIDDGGDEDDELGENGENDRRGRGRGRSGRDGRN